MYKSSLSSLIKTNYKNDFPINSFFFESYSQNLLLSLFDKNSLFIIFFTRLLFFNKCIININKDKIQNYMFCVRSHRIVHMYNL